MQANTLGVRHVAFEGDDIDAAAATVRARGGALAGEVKGIIVELAERIG